MLFEKCCSPRDFPISPQLSDPAWKSLQVELERPKAFPFCTSHHFTFMCSNRVFKKNFWPCKTIERFSNVGQTSLIFNMWPAKPFNPKSHQQSYPPTLLKILSPFKRHGRNQTGEQRKRKIKLYLHNSL